MEAHVRDVHGKSEALQLLSQTHLQSPASTNEMQRYGPFKSSGEPQMLHDFAHHLHPPNFYVVPLQLIYLPHALNG